MTEQFKLLDQAIQRIVQLFQSLVRLLGFPPDDPLPSRLIITRITIE